MGEWCVDPATGQVMRNGESTRVEARTMRLLVCLAERRGEVVSIEELLDQVWPEVEVSPDSVYQAVASLRRVLGDDSKQPAYIATVPRLGYRMVAAVSPWAEAGTARANGAAAGAATERTPAPGGIWPRLMALTLAALVLCGTALYYKMRDRSTRVARESAVRATASETPVSPAPEKTVGVLPLLDLTEGMKEEEFADGMTEELIDKLSLVPGVRVTPPTSAFYYKGKQVPVAEIAKVLGVAYIVDGSVRKSGPRVRLALRLTRADTGYVMWTETYDRGFDDRLKLQDEIAGAVAKAMQASIEERK